MVANVPELRCRIERRVVENPWSERSFVLEITTDFGAAVHVNPSRDGAGGSGGSILSSCCTTDLEPRNRNGVRRCRNCDGELQVGYGHWFTSADDVRLRGFLEAYAMDHLDPLLAAMAVTEYLDVVGKVLATPTAAWPQTKCDFNILTERPKALLKPVKNVKRALPPQPEPSPKAPEEKQRSSAPARTNGTRSSKYVCALHRAVDRPCCDGEKIIVSYRWRAPKKTNDRAWKSIREGHLLWECPRPR